MSEQSRKSPAFWLTVLVCVCLAAGLVFWQRDALLGTRAPESSVQTEQTGPQVSDAVEAEKAPAGEKPLPKRQVYALSEPGEPATPEERDKAVQVIDYANRVDKVFMDSCGQEPAQIMAGVVLYKQAYDAFLLPAKPSPATCLRKALTAPAEGFSSEERAELHKALEEMDVLRTSMRTLYGQLCEYVADDTIIDDGARGQKLSRQIGERLVRYASSHGNFLKVLDKAASSAQDVLLRDHPLRDHVALATQIGTVIQQQASVISLQDPDPGSLEQPLRDLEEKITTAGRLPFPIPGEPEMYYRHYLREAEKLVAILRVGQLQSFHSQVRADLNAAWQACRRQYNLFVDAVNSR